MIFAGLGATIVGWIAQRGIMIGIGAATVAGLLYWDHTRANRLRTEGAKEVVEESRKAGEKRNDEVRKIRRRIKPNDAWNRLRIEYGADRD